MGGIIREGSYHFFVADYGDDTQRVYIVIKGIERGTLVLSAVVPEHGVRMDGGIEIADTHIVVLYNIPKCCLVAPVWGILAAAAPVVLWGVLDLPIAVNVHVCEVAATAGNVDHTVVVQMIAAISEVCFGRAVVSLKTRLG